MYYDGLIWMAQNAEGERISILPKMANRHGLIAGATGTGKTITIKVMAEAFSEMGVPVFMADVKGDIAGTLYPGKDSEDMQKRIKKFGLDTAGFKYKGYPCVLWDLFGQKGLQLRTTVSDMGPLLLSRVLGLNDIQSDILTIVFKIADDRNLLLVDTKDLKAMLNYVTENAADFAADYGRITAASTSAIIRAVVSLEMAGGDVFFGEPALNINDWLVHTSDGRGIINILHSETLISDGKLYSTFLLWLLSELFEALPEVGDLEKPKLVFFFDEAHLLFTDASKLLLTKIEQMVKLIRSKGVGVYFCTQNPRDIPDGVLAQLGNKIEHGLRAYTPADQKTVRAAAESFRENPKFNTYDTILALGTGEAVVSFLDAKGIPGMAEKTSILPPASRMGMITEEERRYAIEKCFLYNKYSSPVDGDSAYEVLQNRSLEQQRQAEEQERLEAEAKEAALKEKEEAKQQALEEKEAAKQQAMEERQAAKEAAQKEKEEQKRKQATSKATKRAVKNVGSTVIGTVGRELGKQVGSSFGSFGKTLGGNLGSSLGRGLFGTLFRG